MSVSNTFHAWLFNLHAVTLQPLNGAVTDPLILWTSVNFQALRRRRATQRLARTRHLRFRQYKIFHFRQAQQFIALRLDGLRFCYFTRTCGVLRSRTIWTLASSAHPSDIWNVFGLIMIETNSRECFNHAQNNHVLAMVRAMHCLI